MTGDEFAEALQWSTLLLFALIMWQVRREVDSLNRGRRKTDGARDDSDGSSS